MVDVRMVVMHGLMVVRVWMEIAEGVRMAALMFLRRRKGGHQVMEIGQGVMETVWGVSEISWEVIEFS